MSRKDVVNGGGYVLVYMPNHPLAHKSGYIFEHRLIASNILRRNLTRNEVMHHINGKPADNRVSNLVVCPLVTGHSAFHGPKDEAFKIWKSNSIFLRDHISIRQRLDEWARGMTRLVEAALRRYLKEGRDGDG